MVSKFENLCLGILTYNQGNLFCFFSHGIFLNVFLEIFHVELNPIWTLLAASRDDLSMLIKTPCGLKVPKCILTY